tara:strand:+ start:288 stop:506 length:219 start_codon:yes stop_codon:yes gene_type:complete
MQHELDKIYQIEHNNIIVYGKLLKVNEYLSGFQTKNFMTIKPECEYQMFWFRSFNKITKEETFVKYKNQHQF